MCGLVEGVWWWEKSNNSCSHSGAKAHILMRDPWLHAHVFTQDPHKSDIVSLWVALSPPSRDVKMLSKRLGGCISADKGRLFFCFSLTRGSCMRPAAKKGKKNTEHERVQFWGTTEHERGLTRTPHGKSTP